MNHVKNKIITRFPPSPTGSLHIGNIRTLLFNYLFTRKHDGEIVMRFEDTDRERSDPEHEQVALDALQALGLTFDKGPFRQSERTDMYIEAIEKLLAQGDAYEGEAASSGAGECVIRFKNPNRKITFTDIVRGEITIDTTDFGDFVIARSKSNPLYHLTVVVDDLDMGVTHIIRGEDHITSTPRQILLIEALQGTRPQYAHLPLIIGPDKKKLGKRHGAVTYQEFEDLGYIPAGILNYLALLGWNPGDDREFFTRDELIQEFSLEKVHNAPAMFSYEKLDSINKHHVLQLDIATYQDAIISFLQKEEGSDALLRHPRLNDLILLVIRERLHKFSEVRTLFREGDFDWFIKTPNIQRDDLLWKDTEVQIIANHLETIRARLESLLIWDIDAIKESIWDYAQDNGTGAVLAPMRRALTGQKRSPDPFTVSFLLGKTTTLNRLADAFALL